VISGMIKKKKRFLSNCRLLRKNEKKGIMEINSTINKAK
jgi:hypothetical protein